MGCFSVLSVWSFLLHQDLYRKYLHIQKTSQLFSDFFKVGYQITQNIYALNMINLSVWQGVELMYPGASQQLSGAHLHNLLFGVW